MGYILYSTHCPKCNVLEKKLNSKNIQYTIIDDVEELKKCNIDAVPVLKVNDKLLNFKEASDYINNI